MTDIQPSPPGYRGQDEAPGQISCSPGSFKYAGHAHHPEQKQQQSIDNYVKCTASAYNNKESYTAAIKQCNEQHGIGHRRKSENCGDRRSTCGENESTLDANNHNVNKKANTASYNEGYKKNTPGYKNDSGYSESIGFDSFSLPLNERDDASPPPTPPVRDASSLKGVCYGPGHEKYPSWPSAPERRTDEEPNDELNGHVGSHRSKSWTDHTNYPKEKPAQYTRPLAKRPNPAFTQQLKTVMERCEKIPAETFESRGGARVNSVEEEPRLWPRVDREGKPLGDAEYVVPSPPEREQQQPSQTISHAELEAYVRSYQDPQVSQVDVYRETALTQAGLEEYTRVQHSQQASYAQSEGYHSYVSSVDSTTNTPFLDRLRRDSEAVAQRPSSTWEEGSREGRDSVVTTSSGGSASSSETLKWHGSLSDVSVSSGLPVRQANNDRWDRGSMSDISSVNGLGTNNLPQKVSAIYHEKWQSSMTDLPSSMLNPATRHSRHSMPSNKWKQDGCKWQSSIDDNNGKDFSSANPRGSLPPSMTHCSSVGDVNRAASPRDGKWQESSIDEDNPERTQRSWESTMSIDGERYSLSRTSQTSESSRSPMLTPSVASNLENSMEWTHGSMSDVSQSNLAVNSSKQLIAHSARVQTPQRHHSESVLYLDRERAQRKLYPIGTTKPPQEPQSSGAASSSRRNSPAVSPQLTHLSVAERISELEKAQQQQTRYTYLDPEKKHRVSDPTLKAIQKKALLSFYERHQSSWRSEPQLAQGSIVPTAQSPPPQPPPRPRPSSSRRASSASDYSTGTWREKMSRNANSTDSPKHQHSNSCGSLSTDLLGPVIVGPAISIDDWVPERPPKKPHLRGAFNDRVPSPDLPPPSPPTVEETEVINCDDPLPPPPPEIGDSCESTSGNMEKRNPRNCQPSERQSRRFKHVKRSERDERNERNSKSSPLTSPVKHVKVNREDSRQNFHRGSRVEEDDLENAATISSARRNVPGGGRSSLRYPPTQKLNVNGRHGTSRRSDERHGASRPPARLPDLVSQRYSDSGNQRPAPQVPVETRIVRQESMRAESTRIDVTGLLRTADTCQRHETSTGQRPQPQVPKCNSVNDKNANVQQASRPNYLAVSESSWLTGKYADNSASYNPVGSPVKTGYEANSKLTAVASPQKYHEPPKYTPGHHQRHADVGQRYCYALVSKYADLTKQKPQPQCPIDRYGPLDHSGASPPPPLAPRLNTPGRKSLPPPPRPAPPHALLQGSQSKASYLAYRRERGAPDSEGSYKRTMSPTARLDEWHHQTSAGSRDHDDPVLLRVTPTYPYQPSPNHHSHNSPSQQNSQQTNELPKSHSVDALHQRIEERNSVHSNEVMSKLSRDLTKKLQTSENRGRTESNNNSSNNNNNGCSESDRDYKDRLSPRSIEAFNDGNRQFERERRKLAASCEPVSRLSSLTNGDANTHGIDDFYRERSATIEMTSRNVELLNRRNTLAERRAAPNVALNFNNGTSSSVTSMENPETVMRSLNIGDKPPPPISSPPRSPNAFSPGEDVGQASLRSVLGAIPRRSGSCSSSSSTSTRSSSEAVQSTRSSPRDSQNDEAITRQELPKIVREIYNEANGDSNNSGRKISSPSQTEKCWTSANTPRARSSQTEVTITNARLGGTSSSRSRSSSLSSAASKISTNSSSSTTSPRYSPTEIKTSPCVSPQPGIEGLTLVQRSEIVLRVNSTTIDASSQTEIFEEDECNDGKTSAGNDVAAVARRKLPEEIECEELSRDLANRLGPDDKLVPILLPAPEHKKPTDYVSGLFRVEATLQSRPRRPLSFDDFNSAVDNENEDDSKNDTMPSTPSTPLSTNDPSSPLSPTSAYFTTSEGKAKFLTRYSRDVTDEDISTNSDSSTRSNATNNANDNLDLRQKKEELVNRLDKKVVVLRAEQDAVREEGELNEALGARVSTRVSAVARPAEASKYRLHVEEVGKITSLLLGLSGRLARAENALYGMPADHPERKILESKRDKLMDQLEEAKILKSNIDKRSVNVSAILSKYLNDDEYADYQHFINMKAKLIMDGREIQDKVKLGEEQLAALKEAIA